MMNRLSAVRNKPIVLTAGFMVLLITVGEAQQAPTTARIYGSSHPYGRTPSILEQLKQLPPSVKQVVVAAGDVQFTSAQAPSVDLLDNFTPDADLIGVVTITNRVSRLVYQDSWINTAVTARLDRVIHDPDRRFTQHETLTLEEEGGQLVIAGRRLETFDQFSSPTITGRQYLMFFRVDEGKLVTMGAALRWPTAS